MQLLKDGFHSVIVSVISCILLAAVAHGATVPDSEDYEIYYGDFNGDGVEGDIYLHGIDSFVILHGEIAIPLMLRGPESYLFVEDGLYNYQQPVPTSISASVLVNSRLGVEGIDYVVGDLLQNGSLEFLIRGVDLYSPSLVVSIKNNIASVIASVDNSGYTYSESAGMSAASIFNANLSDRNVSVTIQQGVLSVGELAFTVDEGSFHPFDATAKNESVATPSLPVLAQPTGINTASIDQVSTLGGMFRVTEQGAAAYSVPIKVPRGTAGVTPKIALSYSSNDGPGLAGIGWNLSAGGAITRCGSTWQIDRYVRPVSFSGFDNFCLNGQRLIPSVENGETVFRTEVDSGVVVRRVGVWPVYTNGPPDYFEVTGRDGTVSRFGGEKDHPSERAIGQTEGRIVYGWHQSELQDNLGNKIEYMYSSSSEYFRLDQVRYGFGNTTQPSAVVSFSYVDPSQHSNELGVFLSGTWFANKSLLESVSSYDEGELLRTYKIRYNEGTADKEFDDLYRVSRIEECAGSGICLPATTFTWGKETIDPVAKNEELVSSFYLETGAEGLVDYKLADINGDGLSDIIVLQQQVDEGDIWSPTKVDFYLRYAIQISPGKFQLQSFYGGEDKLVYYNRDVKVDGGGIELAAFDANGDGRTDLAIYDSNGGSKWGLFVSYPKAVGEWYLKPVSSSDYSFPVSHKDAKFLDFNGDGIVDVIDNFDLYLGERNPSPPEISLPYRLSASSETLRYRGKYADFNNDGLLDVAVISSSFHTIHEGGTRCEIRQSLAVVAQERNSDGQLSFGFSDTVFKTTALTDTQMGSCTPDIYDYPIYRFDVADVNGDGNVDVYWMQKKASFLSLNKGGRSVHYALNHGKGRFGNAKYLVWQDSDGHSFGDVDGDGDNDFIYRVDVSNENSGPQSIMVRKWNGDGFDEAQALVQDEHDDAMNAFVDINADGAVDRLRIYKSNVYLDTWSNYFPSHRIEAIENGLGNRTKISYELLNNSKNYRDTAELSTEILVKYEIGPNGKPNIVTDGIQFDIDTFYGRLVDPFQGVAQEHSLLPERVAPILEYVAPLPIVTAVASSMPTAGDSSNITQISYFYEEAKIQAAGRGFLGFKKLTTIDHSSSIRTSTTYRQDWPFIGMPVVTESYAGSVLLKQSSTQYAIQGVKVAGIDEGQSIDSMRTTYETEGSKALGPLVVNQYKQVDKNYQLKQNGASQGELIKRVELVKKVDEFGNAVSIVEELFDGESDAYSLRKEVINDFGSDYYSKVTGRLFSTSVTHSRPGKPSHTATSQFGYVGLGSNDCDLDAMYTGMLCKETSSPSDPRNRVDTYHYYDNFGNLSFSKKSSVDGARLSQFSEFDSKGRFINRTYGVFDERASTTGSVPDVAYANIATSVGANVQMLEEVVNRDRHGTALEIRRYVDDDSYIVERAWTTDFGTVYFVADSEGNSKKTVPSKSDLSNCPSGATFSVSVTKAGGAKGKTCKDFLGRTLRELTLSFNGQKWSAIDTEYNGSGNLARRSEPYFIGDSVHWSDIEYDILGRAILTRHAYNEVDGNGNVTSVRAISSIEYTGLSKVLTNAKGQQKTEVNNVLGELDHVITAEGTIRYEYDALGNMEKMITSSATTVINHDAFGRKESMSDPDKGFWQYHYNAFGEIVCQIDAKKQTTVNHYDFAGRLVQRIDRKPGGSCPNPTGEIVGSAQWFYDTAENGLGQIAYSDDSKSNFSKRQSYDEFGRVSATVTQFPGADGKLSNHFERVTYDRFGRIFQVFDAARNSASYNHNGIHYHYNSSGFLHSINDAADGGAGPTYYRVVAVDARGNVTDAEYGDGVVEVGRHYLPQTGLINNIRAMVGVYNVQDLTVRWDHVGNVHDRQELGVGAGSSSKKITEIFEYDHVNRLTDYHVAAPNTSSHSVHLEYNALGNIVNKSDVASADYQYTSGRPHAVTSAGGVTYKYDANGSMYYDTSGRTIDYSTFDMAVRIDIAGRHRTEFQYDVDRGRFKRVDMPLNSNGDPLISEATTTLYVGSVEKTYYPDGSSKWKRNIGGVALITHSFDAAKKETKTTDYLLKDHLGSINYIVSSTGSILAEMAFDPWGKRRNTLDWRSLQPSSVLAAYSVLKKPITTRGFTGHEMLDESGIIHMNGRIYDPHLGRFLQADPIVQDPSIPGSLNRYSYVFNNPLNATDPSGYSALLLLDIALIYATMKLAADDRTAGQIMMVAATAVAAWACGPCAAGVAAAFTASIAYMNGYSAVDAFYMGMQAGMHSVLSYGIFTNIGAAFGNEGGLWFEFGTKNGFWHIASHATAGGVLSVLQGGKFGHGFASAGIVKGLAPVIDLATAKWGYPGGMITSMVIGGTASDVSGGKFANGAITAVFQYHFNQCGGNAENCKADNQKGLDQDLVKKYNALKTRVTKNLAQVEGAVPTLSTTELALIVEYEVGRIKLIDPSVTNYLDNMAGSNPAPSDTFFRSFGDAAFFIQGFGSVRAHHINYIGVGIMSAHYGSLSEYMLDGQVINWNLFQAGTGGTSNLNDIPASRYWAQKGIEWYDNY